MKAFSLATPHIATKTGAKQAKWTCVVQLCHSAPLGPGDFGRPRPPAAGGKILSPFGPSARDRKSQWVQPAGAVDLMKKATFLRSAAVLGVTLGLAGCGGTSSGKLFSWGGPATAPQKQETAFDKFNAKPKESTIWDLFGNNEDPNVTLQVNKYLWNASLEVLDFLPIQSVDPFSGLIVTGYGTPPGGGRAYKATIHITDPALDARSLKVALDSRGGAVAPETVRAVEDAILTRARQLRIRDSNL